MRALTLNAPFLSAPLSLPVSPKRPPGNSRRCPRPVKNVTTAVRAGGAPSYGNARALQRGLADSHCSLSARALPRRPTISGPPSHGRATASRLSGVLWAQIPFQHGCWQEAVWLFHFSGPPLHTKGRVGQNAPGLRSRLRRLLPAERPEAARARLKLRCAALGREAGSRDALRGCCPARPGRELLEGLGIRVTPSPRKYRKGCANLTRGQKPPAENPSEFFSLWFLSSSLFPSFLL